MPGVEGNRWLVDALRDLKARADAAGHPITRATIFAKDVEYADLIEFSGGGVFHVYPEVPLRSITTKEPTDG